MMNSLVTFFEVVLTFFIPAVVWAVLAAGLAQLIAGGVRKVRVAPRRLVRGQSAQQAR